MFARSTLMAILLFAAAPFQKEKAGIAIEEVRAYILKQADCPEDYPNPLYISHTEHADLTHNGRDNFVVVGGTCDAGTAGPDVHAVFSRDVDGALIELPIEEGTIPPRALFGNRNYRLLANGGELVAEYYDTSDRKHPLVIRYRWDGQRFRESSRTVAKPFRTSYDCAQATQETEQAICASESLARLDVELHTVYLERLRSASAQERAALKQEQRHWLQQRNSACTIYKWWVECLTALYQRRIAALRGNPQPQTPGGAKSGTPGETRFENRLLPGAISRRTIVASGQLRLPISWSAC